MMVTGLSTEHFFFFKNSKQHAQIQFYRPFSVVLSISKIQSKRNSQHMCLIGC